MIHDLGPLSESLRRHRADRGDDPRMLGPRRRVGVRPTISPICEAAGRLSRFMRRRVLLDTDQFLRECRSIGLTRVGQPMAGLPEDVVFPSHDRVRAVTDATTSRDGRYPRSSSTSCSTPPPWTGLRRPSTLGTRAMVELQALVGRRTAELCGLRWDCLRVEEVLDETGAIRPAPVLVHDMPKVAVRRFRLPIDGQAAEIIGAQQARVRAPLPRHGHRTADAVPGPGPQSPRREAVQPGHLRRAAPRLGRTSAAPSRRPRRRRL